MAEAFTVSRMLSSMNEVMAPVATDDNAKISLQRRMDNGVLLNTSEKEIAALDTKAKVRHAAELTSSLDKQSKHHWVQEQRQRGNEAFGKKEYASAADIYLQALAGLDFGYTPEEKRQCQLDLQLPLTCNLTACFLSLQEWEKARAISCQALLINPSSTKALRQRARAYTKLHFFSKARDDIAIAMTTLASSENVKAELELLERQKRDIDREEQRSTIQNRQQASFHKKMMVNAVGKLYEDKKEVESQIEPAESFSFATFKQKLWELSSSILHLDVMGVKEKCQSLLRMFTRHQGKVE